MKWSAIGFWAVLTEVLAHVLSLSWGFGMLVVAFVWTAGMLRTTSVKAQTTEQRVNALIPQVNTAITTANNCLPLSGGTVTGALTVNGDLKTHSNLLTDNTLFVNGSSWQLSIPQSRATGLTACPNPPTQAWGNTVVSAITQINTNLQPAGIFS